MAKWGIRIFAVIFSLVVLTAISFYVWRAGIIQNLEHDPARRVTSTDLGVVEYAIAGEGRLPVLMIHGSPGGYDQSLIGARAAPNTFLPDTMTIAVSRPGFLGTPLQPGTTHQTEADLYAALLDELGIVEVVVIATSAGGRTGLQFAVRHPHRTKALVLRSARISQITHNEDDSQNSAALVFNDFLMWVGSRFPSTWINDFDQNDALQTKMVELLIASTVPQSKRIIGAKYNRDQYRASPIESWPLKSLAVPTLILHGDADSLVPYRNAQIAASLIPRAKLVTIQGGDHFMHVTHLSELSEQIMRFVHQPESR